MHLLVFYGFPILKIQIINAFNRKMTIHLFLIALYNVFFLLYLRVNDEIVTLTHEQTRL